MDARRRRRDLTASGVLLGLGLGGFFDGIVLHQLLQWHHMVSHVDDYPTTTVAGLEANTLGDGLFHAGTYLCTVAGVALLWRATRGAEVPWSTRALSGLVLVGWGLFNVAEGLVDHHLLGLHHVKEDAANRLAWDVAFLVWGAAMLGGGWWMARTGRAS